MSSKETQESAPSVSRCYVNDPEWGNDIAYAMNSAIEYLESEQFGGENAERQVAAYKEVARRIRRMMDRHITSR